MKERAKVLFFWLFLVISLLILPSKGVACISFFSNSDAQHRCVSLNAKEMGLPGYFETGADLKSKSVARMYSAVFTAVPIGLSRVASNGWQLSDQSITSMFLIVSGSVMGPSAGSIYADDWGIIRNGVITRSLSLALVITGSILNEYYSDDGHLLSIGRVLQLTGLGFFAGSAFYDTLFVSAHSVEYHNARVRMSVGISSIGTLQNEVTNYPDLQIQFPF